MKTLLLLGPRHCEDLRVIADTARALGLPTVICTGNFGDELPERVHYACEDDVILSYRGRWVLPKHVIDNAGLALNIHPGPPEWRGIGCVNQALYSNAQEYGCTLHHVAPALDSGPICGVVRFDVKPSDTVESVLRRTYAHMLRIALNVVGDVAVGAPFPADPSYAWSPTLYTRKELDALAAITLDMPPAEIERRIRATTFGKWKPTLAIGGKQYPIG